MAQPTRTETKSIFRGFEVKAVNATARTFEGLANTWDQDLGGDVVHPGAFKRTLDHWRESGRVVPLIDQHNYGSVRSVVGKMLDAKETDDGLWAEFHVIEGDDGDEVMRRIEGGYVDGLSIGYRAIKTEQPTEEEQLQGIWRHLKEVELREVSVVIWPMNVGSRIDTDSVKTLVQSMTRKGTALTDDERAALTAIRDDINALLTDPLESNGKDSGTPDGPAESPDGGQEVGPPDFSRLDTLRLRTLALAD